MRVYAKLGSLNHHYAPDGTYAPIPNLDLFAVCLAELAVLSEADGDRHAASLGTESFAEIVKLLGTYAPPFAYFGFSTSHPTDLGFHLKSRPHVLAIQGGVSVVDGEDFTGVSDSLALADEGYGEWSLYWVGDQGRVRLWDFRSPSDGSLIRCEGMPSDEDLILDAAADAQRMLDAAPLCFGYVNYRGEFANRVVQPISVEWGETLYHHDAGWHLKAHDLEKGAERSFLMRDIVTPFWDVPRDPGEMRPYATPVGLGDPLKRGDVLRCIDDHGTLAVIWSPS
jgi:hypothetical protein